MEWKTIDSAPKDGRCLYVVQSGMKFPDIIEWFKYEDDELIEETGETGCWVFCEDLINDVSSVNINEYTHYAEVVLP